MKHISTDDQLKMMINEDARFCLDQAAMGNYEPIIRAMKRNDRCLLDRQDIRDAIAKRILEAA